MELCLSEGGELNMKTSDADSKDLDTMIRDLGLLVSSIGAWNLWEHNLAGEDESDASYACDIVKSRWTWLQPWGRMQPWWCRAGWAPALPKGSCATTGLTTMPKSAFLPWSLRKKRRGVLGRRKCVEQIPAVPLK